MLGDIARFMADAAGAGFESALGRLTSLPLSAIAPVARGRRAVIAIPGFMADDSAFSVMNRFLTRQGFLAETWGLGRNRGPTRTGWNAYFDRVASHLSGRIHALADSTGHPVALVGHSLGGVFARELTSRLPEHVDRVITLAAPTIHPYRQERHNRFIRMTSELLHRESILELGGAKGLLHWAADGPRIPCVAIHSPIDGLVHESACHIPGYIVAQSRALGPRENLRVLATHIGMTVSPWVLLAVADRLLADRRHWRSFDPRRYFPATPTALLRVFYPPGDALWRDRGVAAFVRGER